MNRFRAAVAAASAFALLAGAGLAAAAAQAAGQGIEQIQTVVVIFAENRSFDNLYGRFPGANGIAQAQNKNELNTFQSIIWSISPSSTR